MKFIMKKVLLMAAFAVASLAANAQLYVGGSLGFQSAKAGDGADNITKIQIAPEFGYNLSEDFAVGMTIDFTTRNGNIAADGTTSQATKWGDSQSCFKFAPYARYTFAKSGIASFFVDGGVGFSFFNNEGGMVIGLGVRPGVKLAASEKVDLVAKLGYLGYQFGNDKHGKDSQFGLGIDNTDISFGVYYNF